MSLKCETFYYGMLGFRVQKKKMKLLNSSVFFLVKVLVKQGRKKKRKIKIFAFLFQGDQNPEKSEPELERGVGDEPPWG